MKPTGIDDFPRDPDPITGRDWFLVVVAFVIVMALFCTDTGALS